MCLEIMDVCLCNVGDHNSCEVVLVQLFTDQFLHIFIIRWNVAVISRLENQRRKHRSDQKGEDGHDKVGDNGGGDWHDGDDGKLNGSGQQPRNRHFE